MKKVLSTKMLDASVVAHAHSLGLDIQCMDFIETKAINFILEPVLQKKYDAVIFTSAKAVKYFFENAHWCQTLSKPAGEEVSDTLLNKGTRHDQTPGKPAGEEVSDTLLNKGTRHDQTPGKPAGEEVSDTLLNKGTRHDQTPGKPAGEEVSDTLLNKSTLHDQTPGKPIAVQVSDTLPVFSTGYKTAEALREATGTESTLSASNASDLADKIIQSSSAKSVLHICGDKTLDIIKVKLESKGIEYTSLVVYNTVLLNTKLPQQNFDAIMFFSPTGVKSFYAYNKPNAETLCCCIGGTTAQALRKTDAKANIIISKQPSAEAMVDIMSKYFQNDKLIK